MRSPRAPLPSSEPQALHDRAMDDLRFIRRTMEQAGSFTAVPGWGGVAMGATALAAGAVAAGRPTFEGWLWTWIGAAAVAAAIALAALALKARHAGLSLRSGPGRTFVLSLLPPLIAGAALTPALYQAGATAAIPGAWLLLYGVGVVAAGTFSVRIVPVLGFSFMLLGMAALLSPPAWADLYMAVGFGGLHVVFGALIAWRHGG